METLNMLFEITVYSAVIFTATLLLKTCFKSKMSPFLHYAVWFALMLRLMMPVTIASPVSLFVIPAEAQNQAAIEQPQPQDYEPVSVPDIIETNTAEAQLQTGMTEAYIPSEPQAAPMEAQTPAALSLPQVLTIIWLAGAGLCLTYLAVLYASLRVKLSRISAQPSKRLSSLLEIVKAEMGISANIKLVCMYEYGTPSLMFPRTIMMPADALVAMDEEQTRFALRHELMHYKRGDHIISILLSLLNAVYWFNPFVWLAFRQMRADMETACDSNVIKLLGGSAKSRYASLILNLSSRPAHRQLVLGMSHSDARKVAERRVKGIFMKGESKMSVKLITVLLAAALVFTCFTTACQPVTETAVATNQQEVAPANVTPVDFEKIEAPEHISEVYDKSENLKITYDADVVVPETNAYPVTEVKKRIFSDDDILSFIKLCAGKNDELYSSWTLTKDEYSRILDKVKKYEGTERVTQETLNLLQEIYDKATNDVENPRVKSLSELPTDRPPFAYIPNVNGNVAYITFNKDGNDFAYTRDEYTAVYAKSMVADSLYEPNMDGPIENFRWLQPGEPEISQQDAYSVAQQYMDTLGIDLDLYSAEPCSFIKNYIDKTTGWQFTLTRKISNLRAIDDTGGFSWNRSTPPSCASPWGEEKLTISVDKDGLFSLWWRGASMISSTVTESAQLEDFGTIQQKITDQLNSLCASWGKDQGKNLEIVITKIELGISLLSVEDETDIGEYIPTWYVTYYPKFGDGSEITEIQQIMFNAIDGSYVEPRLSNEDLMGKMDTGSDSADVPGPVPTK